MTIQTPYVPTAYNGDGITSSFPIVFPYQLSSDIVVITEVVATGVITHLTLGSGYTVTPTTNSPAATGTVALLTGALPVGTNLLISRSVPNTQLTRWIPNDPNPSIAIENAVDKLTMELQQNAYGNIRTWFLRPFDVDGSGMFDARGNRGGNAADPQLAQDFVTLSYMTNYVTQLIQTGFVGTPADYEYIGDGTTTAFAIPGATVPQSTGYYVSLDGLVQRPTSDYAITLGATPQCVFLTAPALGVLVSIRVLGFAQPILVGIDGSQIISGRVLPQFLGTGAATVSTFLRGDGAWTNTLIGQLGPVTVPITNPSYVMDLQNNGSATLRISAANGRNVNIFFGMGGSSTDHEAAIVYDNVDDAMFFVDANSVIRQQFRDNGDAFLCNNVLSAINSTNRVGINKTNPQFDLDVNGTVNANEYLGNADGSLITSGQVDPQFLASNTPSNSLFLRGDGIWAIPPGGGGGGGPTTIQVSDAAIASSTMGTMTLAGSAAGASGVTVPLYINTISAGTANIRGSVSGSGANKPGVITSTTLTDTAWSVSSAAGNVLRDVDGISAPSWGKLTHSNLAATGTADANHFLSGADTWSKIGISGIDAINSPTNTFIPSYDSGTGKWKWVSNSTLPAGGTAGAFLRGDTAWSDVLDVTLASDTGLILGSGTSSGSFGAKMTVVPASNLVFIAGVKNTAGTWFSTPTGKVWNYQFGGEPGVVSVGSAWTSIDSSTVESMYLPGILRTATAVRSLQGAWQQMVVVNAPAASITVDVNDGSYQRLTGFANNVSITLADTTPLPSNSAYRYAGHLTLELNSIGSFDITWPGTITWAGGASAPTVANGGLSSSGINIVKLIRRQGQTQWVGYLDNVSSAGGGSYTDNQARQAVMNSTALPNSSTIGWTFSGSPANQTGVAAIVAGSIGNTQLASSGLLASKLAGYPSDGTKYLAGDGTWTVPPGTGGGGGGQDAVQFQNEGINIGGSGTTTVVNFVGNAVNAANSGTTITATINNAFWQGTGLFGSSSFTTIQLGTGLTGTDMGSGLLKIDASGGGGSFSPATSYTWTAGQAFNAANTHGATDFYNVALQSPYSGTAKVGIGGLGDSVFGGSSAALYANVLNNSSVANSPKTQTATFYQVLNNPGAGINAVEGTLDIRGNCATNGFHIGFTQLTSARRKNNSGFTDAVWLVSSSPDSTYSSSPDPNGIIHSFSSGVVRIGEVNYGNAWQDFGLQEKRGLGRNVVGMEFFPDFITGPVGNPSPHEYHGNWAIGIGYSGLDAFGFQPQNHIGVLVDVNGIAPDGYALRLWGSNGTFNGNSAATNAPAAIIKMSGTAKAAIDLAGTLNDSTPLTIVAETLSGHSNKPAIILDSGQAICFKHSTTSNTGVYMWFDGTNLRATKDGGNTSVIVV